VGRWEGGRGQPGGAAPAGHTACMRRRRVWGKKRTLVGRIITIDDNAGYHNSSKPTDHMRAIPAA